MQAYVKEMFKNLFLVKESDFSMKANIAFDDNQLKFFIIQLVRNFISLAFSYNKENNQLMRISKEHQFYIKDIVNKIHSNYGYGWENIKKMLHDVLAYLYILRFGDVVIRLYCHNIWINTINTSDEYYYNPILTFIIDRKKLMKYKSKRKKKTDAVEDEPIKISAVYESKEGEIIHFVFRVSSNMLDRTLKKYLNSLNKFRSKTMHITVFPIIEEKISIERIYPHSLPIFDNEKNEIQHNIPLDGSNLVYYNKIKIISIFEDVEYL
jgi:hypothetical protein